MKKLSELNRKEKLKLLSLIQKGEINKDELTEDMKVLEHPDELFPFIASGRKVRFIAIDEKVISELKIIEKKWDELAEKRSRKRLCGAKYDSNQTYNTTK